MNKKSAIILVAITTLAIIFVVILNPFRTVGGPGHYFMSFDEAASLIGSNGTYNVTGPIAGTSTLMDIFGGKGWEPASLVNNVTYAWEITYFINKHKSIESELFENVFQAINAQKAKYIYCVYGGCQPYNVTNATYAGVTYSYSLEGNSSVHGIFFVAYKGNYVVQLQLSSNQLINVTSIAAIIAGDLS
jgi:hypothetical protein